MNQENQTKSTYQPEKPINKTAFKYYKKTLLENEKLKAKELSLKELIKKVWDILNEK